MLGASYALWTTSEEQKSMNVLNTNCIKLEMEELSGEIKLEKAYPILDKEGEELDPYKFRIKNVCNTGVDYNVNIEVLEESTMEAKNIAAKIDEELKVLLTPTHQTTPIETEEYNAKEAYNIYTGNLKPNESKEHEIRLWMDESAGNESQNKTFKAKVVISGTSNEIGAYTEKLLNGADPILKGELVPVTIGDDGTVKKADITTEWYKYEDKKWANAVILVDNNQADTIQPGQEIPEDQIESYFVWIPKYKYKIFDIGHYETAEEILDTKKQNTPIEIQFDLEDTKDENPGECASPNESGKDGTCAVDKWMTHPAFTAFPGSHGMWVGKFETSSVDNSKIQIKPNVSSWRNTTVGNSFNVSKNYSPNLDSHMMKNTEWGAAAYLTQSMYGRCANGSCEKVTINSNTEYKTGYENSDQAWPNSQNASTTGNNSGIFDMSGGAWEYVAGVMTSATSASDIHLDNIVFNQSGLNSTEIADLKYIDLYTQGNETQYNRRILGDATGETGPFHEETYKINAYSEESYFVNQDNSWFQRGGGNGNTSNSGIFAFSRYNGINYDTLAFRIVLTP